ncbi:MAG: hypothetical protein AB1896_22285 [Thermodesulfobacteriota bacterium]
MNDRYILKGRLGELRARRMELQARAADLVEALRTKVLPIEVVKLEDMDTAGIRRLAGDLEEIRGEYLSVCEDCRRIERELGE